ncbi:UNKNOWN [Stylonychia lemnae]|uniref:Transmembrane protein n=1 Tax=Stylonychia lemnae TaxID=5949 RepID=A0A078BDM2_STYLE|nr:UNKNOWN [Stylonychia lemnae]|eukprot:CDW91282.1 UNKNOWN [Stylonychia lemnae]
MSLFDQKSPLKDLEISHEQRYGLLDVGKASYNRQEELLHKKQLSLFLLRLKRIAQLLLAFSLFIILNDCVGLSSTPFYFPRVGCNLLEPNHACNTLKHLSSALYIIEMSGGFLLAAQASGIYYFLDNQQNSKTSANVRNLTKAFLGLYIIIVITRIILFTQLLSWAQNEIPNTQQESNFGVFLGNFVETEALQIIVTLLILLSIISCFVLSFLSIRYITIVDNMTHNQRNHKLRYYGILGQLEQAKSFELQMSLMNKSHQEQNPDESSSVVANFDDNSNRNVKYQQQVTGNFNRFSEKILEELKVSDSDE